MRFSFDAWRRRKQKLSLLRNSTWNTVNQRLFHFIQLSIYLLVTHRALQLLHCLVERSLHILNLTDVIQTIYNTCTGQLKCRIPTKTFLALFVGHSSIELTRKENCFNNSRRVVQRRQSCKMPLPRSLLLISFLLSIYCLFNIKFVSLMKCLHSISLSTHCFEVE